MHAPCLWKGFAHVLLYGAPITGVIFYKMFFFSRLVTQGETGDHALGWGSGRARYGSEPK